jgi:outer membrane protein assembly factor BamB
MRSMVKTLKLIALVFAVITICACNKGRWEFATGGAVGSSPAVTGEYVYVGSNDGKVYGLKATDGEAGSWPMFRYNPERTGAR